MIGALRLILRDQSFCSQCNTPIEDGELCEPCQLDGETDNDEGRW